MARQAILTKYIAATNSRGARIKASCARGSMFVPYPHELSGADVHIYAAGMLVNKFVEMDREHEDAKLAQWIKDGKKPYTPSESSWLNKRVCGQLPNGDYAHVFTEEK